MELPDTPPAHARRTVSAAERDKIERVLGAVADDSLLRAVRDGRGRVFQRLEFLGDSVLDLVLQVHRWVEVDCPRCLLHDPGPDASDHALTRAAQAVGLGAWLEWRASDERLADLVETCVAACWLSGRWPQVLPFVAAVVHPVGPATLAGLVTGSKGESGKAARRVGSAVLELAAASAVYHDLPDADEGVLSQARAAVHRAGFVAARARHLDGAVDAQVADGDDEAVLSEVETRLADALAARGADDSLRAARAFVTRPRR